MNKQELAAMVAEILSGMEHEPPVKGGDYRPTAPQPEKAPTPVPGRRLCPGCDGAGVYGSSIWWNTPKTRINFGK